MELPMGKYYRWAVIYPSILVLIVSMILIVIENRTYKSEWLTVETVIVLTFLVTFLFTSFIVLLSLPILLNKYSSVRNDFTKSVLSWFLFPFTFIMVVIVSLFSEHADKESYYFMLCTIPFIISLTWTFIHFRKSLEKKNPTHYQFNKNNK